MEKILEDEPISFPDWAEKLPSLDLPAGQIAALRSEILAFLRHCRRAGVPVTVALARQYLVLRKDRVPRLALRWFVTHGRAVPLRWGEASLPLQGINPGVTGGATPLPARKARASGSPRASADLGTPGWEAALIAASRRRGFLWRTEQTYREWASRFAR